MLPERDGWSILAALRKAGKQTPVLFLTARYDKVKGLELGADGYLVKPFDFAELLARVRTILRRGPARQADILRVADLQLDLPLRKAIRAGVRLDLTAKELALLELLVRRQGEPLYRDTLTRSILQGLNDNGCLILVEKVLGEHSIFNRQFIDYHYDLKKRYGYSELEIAQKREALETVLVPYRLMENWGMLLRAGFRCCDVFFKWYNFCCMVVQQRIAELVEQQRRAGAALIVEVAAIRMALTKLQADEADAQRQMTDARTRLAEALGLPVAALEGVRFGFPLEPVWDPTALLDKAEARRLALRQRSDIRAVLAEYEASQAALQLEVAKQYPGLHLGSGYQWDQGDHKWNLALTLELPILNRNQGPIAEAEARRKETAAQLLALQAEVITDD